MRTPRSGFLRLSVAWVAGFAIVGAWAATADAPDSTTTAQKRSVRDHDPADAPDRLFGASPSRRADDADCEEGATRPGFLSVNTVPWTRVLIDEAPHGSTPMFRRRLESGKHHLRFVNEAYGIDVSDEVEIEEGRTLKLRLYLALDFARSADMSFSPFDETGAEPLCSDTASERPAFLSIRTDPWAKVFVDGAYLGHTPLFRIQLAPGDHVLRLVRDDGSAMMNAFSRFHAESGEVVKFDLGPGADMSL